MESQNRKRIIVVEDSASIREIVVFSLKNSGFDVVCASNGVEAISLFDGRKMDLLLTDYHMPEMNGLELIRWVRGIKQYKRLPIVVLTTENQKSVILKAKEAGATGWLNKPFSLEKLTQVIRRVIG